MRRRGNSRVPIIIQDALRRVLWLLLKSKDPPCRIEIIARRRTAGVATKWFGCSQGFVEAAIRNSAIIS
jgi:hypothetical protein